MKNNYKNAKEDVMWAVKTMVEKGYALGTAGNISARIEGEDLFVITPSSRKYLSLKEDDLCVIDMDGNIVEGKYKPSIETTMHRYIFLQRPEVNAIVHSHSKYATLVGSIEGIDCLPIIDIESVGQLGGEVPIAPFAPAGSLVLAENIKNSIGNSAGVIMENHGAIGVGINMEKAMIASDNIERTSEQYLLLLATGKKIKELPKDYVKEVMKASLKGRKVIPE